MEAGFGVDAAEEKKQVQLAVFGVLELAKGFEPPTA